VILLLNGAFGIGKTTVARALVARMPRARLFDPERIGIALQRVTRVGDFQDLRLWRWLTIQAIRVMRRFTPNLVVPMAFSNPAYLREIRAGVSRFEPRVVHVCLVAPLEVVRERLHRRGRDANEWVRRRAAECCIAHASEEFAMQVSAGDRAPDAIADEILRTVAG
jgi:chloramphenicol 3-O-phosphotransferase